MALYCISVTKLLLFTSRKNTPRRALLLHCAAPQWRVTWERSCCWYLGKRKRSSLTSQQVPTLTYSPSLFRLNSYVRASTYAWRRWKIRKVNRIRRHPHLLCYLLLGLITMKVWCLTTEQYSALNCSAQKYNSFPSNCKSCSSTSFFANDFPYCMRTRDVMRYYRTSLLSF